VPKGAMGCCPVPTTIPGGVRSMQKPAHFTWTPWLAQSWNE